MAYVRKIQKTVLLVLISSLVLAVAPASALSRSVPQGFFGVDMDPWALSDAGKNIDAELSTAASNGVESVRVPVYWFDAQPYSAMDRVPATAQPSFTPATDGGAPNRWGAIDAFMRATSSRGIRVLPVVMGAPRWAAEAPANKAINSPADPQTYARFLTALVERYGPAGSFWSENPDLAATPITTWQIWNEPDLAYYWPQHAGETQTVAVNGKIKRVRGLGFAPSYTRLLRAAHSAIRKADPNAQVLLASLTNRAWLSLKQVYSSGARGNFDQVGANIFSKTPANLVTAIKTIRSIMAANGDSRLPYVATEYSWSSGIGAIPFSSHMGWLVTSATNQARNAGQAMDLFTKYRTSLKLRGAFWYTWASPDSGVDSVWDYAGLRKVAPTAVTSKPVLATYARKALLAEGCATKQIATDCVR